MLLLFSTKVSQAAFTKVIMPVIGRKGTNKRAKYKIKIILFLLSSESTLSKGTIKRGKYQRKINFSLNFRAKVPSLKVRLSEQNTKGKLFFCQLFQENDCQLFQEIKPTPTPPKKEGRLNLYQGLGAIHSTLFRGCTHTRCLILI